MASISQSLSENPVAQAELNHQQRAISERRWRRFPIIFGLALVIALLSNLALMIAPQLAGLFGLPLSDLTGVLRGWFGTLVIIMGALIMIHHLTFTTGVLQLASSAIAREKQGRTWESLLLTGVDARRIVVGKWWATLRAVWRDYRLMLVLRLLVALWSGMSDGIGHLLPLLPPSVLTIALLSVVVAIFPLCYGAFTASLGLLVSLFVSREVTAYRAASMLHFGLLIVSLGLAALSFALPLNSVELGATAAIPALFITPLDGGMLTVLGVASDVAPSYGYYGFGILLCILLYAGLAWAVLRAAQAVAVRQRASPPI